MFKCLEYLTSERPRLVDLTVQGKGYLAGAGEPRVRLMTSDGSTVMKIGLYYPKLDLTNKITSDLSNILDLSATLEIFKLGRGGILLTQFLVISLITFQLHTIYRSKGKIERT